MGMRGLRLSGLAQEQIEGCCVRKGTLGLLEMQGISWLAAQVLPSQTGLCSVETVKDIMCPAIKLTNDSKRDKALSAAHNSVQHWPNTIQQSYCFTMFIWRQASLDNECRKWRRYFHRLKKVQTGDGVRPAYQMVSFLNPYSAEIKNEWIYTSILAYMLSRRAQEWRHRSYHIFTGLT